MKEKKVKNVLVSAYISPELYEKFSIYVGKFAQGNASFALRLAIELLVAEKNKC